MRRELTVGHRTRGSLRGAVAVEPEERPTAALQFETDASVRSHEKPRSCGTRKAPACRSFSLFVFTNAVAPLDRSQGSSRFRLPQARSANLIAGPICGLPATSRRSMPRAAALASPNASFSMRTVAQHKSSGARKASHSARVFVANSATKYSISGVCDSPGSPLAMSRKSSRSSARSAGFHQNFGSVAREHDELAVFGLIDTVHRLAAIVAASQERLRRAALGPATLPEMFGVQASSVSYIAMSICSPRPVFSRA